MAEAKGFFTDTSVCIGCKACEVACKEWNQLSGNAPTFLADSFDNTGKLDAENWRHVKFIENDAHLTASTTVGDGQA
ncbi:MAG TPA: 4Fe-4S ferredoxin, partial [Candidatus Dormibacteraeota bacterium]|nr:4Fe-4S ferredoxin [Candidatus Dormibacteraeota bacterium]